MKQFIFTVLALLASAVPQQLFAQEEDITLTLAETNLAEALIKIDEQCKTKHINFIYNELENMPVNTSFAHLNADQAVLQAVGILPVYVMFTPKNIFVESQNHEGESQISNLMNNVNMVSELKEVTVDGKNLEFDHGTHLAVIPRERDIKASSRAIVLLSLMRLPGLNADPALGKITIDGGEPILMVNGKERNKERVFNLNPEKILRIEYSNNPGIRYLDRGARGIINFVLKEPEDGGGIYAHAESALTTGFANSYLNGSYNKGRSEFSIEYNNNIRDYDDDPLHQTEQYNAPSNSLSRQTEGNTLMNYVFQYLTAEYTYQHNDSTMFVASFRNLFFNHHSHSTADIQESSASLDKSIEEKSRYHHRQYEPKLDLYFKHKFAHQQEIELNVVNEWGSNRDDKKTNFTYTDNATQLVSSKSFPIFTKNTGWAISSEAVYNKKFGKQQMRLGIQYQHNLARNNYEEQNIESKMTKDNAYLFGELNGELSAKVNYVIGTGVKLFAVSENGAHEQYYRNLSTARIGWRINDQWNIAGEVNLTPELPSLSQLTNVLQVSTDLEATQGNASLKPSNNVASRLTLRYNAPKYFYSNIYFGYEHTFDPIFDSYRYDEATKYYIQSPHNGEHFKYSYQRAEIGLRDLWDHLTISADMAYKQQESKGEDFLHTYRHFCGDLNVSYVWKTLVVGCGFNFSPNWSLWGENLSRDEREQHIFAQYRLKHWTFNATWHCPFNPKGYRYIQKNMSELHPWTIRNNIGNNSNMICIGATYQANFGKSFKKGEKTLWNGGYDNGTIK